MENKTKAFTSRDLVSSSLDLNSSPSKSQGRLAEREGFHLAFREAIIDNLGSNGQFQPFSDLLERSENSLSQASAKDILLFLEIVLVYATPRFYSTINTSDTLDRVFSKWFSKIKSNEAYRGILPPLLLVILRLMEDKAGRELAVVRSVVSLKGEARKIIDSSVLVELADKMLARFNEMSELKEKNAASKSAKRPESLHAGSRKNHEPIPRSISILLPGGGVDFRTVDGGAASGSGTRYISSKKTIAVPPPKLTSSRTQANTVPTRTLLQSVRNELTIKNIRAAPTSTAQSFNKAIDVIGANKVIEETGREDRNTIMHLLATIGAPHTFYRELSASASVRSVLQHWIESTIRIGEDWEAIYDLVSVLLRLINSVTSLDDEQFLRELIFLRDNPLLLNDPPLRVRSHAIQTRAVEISGQYWGDAKGILTPFQQSQFDWIETINENQIHHFAPVEPTEPSKQNKAVKKPTARKSRAKKVPSAVHEAGQVSKLRSSSSLKQSDGTTPGGSEPTGEGDGAGASSTRTVSAVGKPKGLISGTNKNNSAPIQLLKITTQTNLKPPIITRVPMPTSSSSNKQKAPPSAVQNSTREGESDDDEAGIIDHTRGKCGMKGRRVVIPTADDEDDYTVKGGTVQKLPVNARPKKENQRKSVNGNR